MAGFSFIARCGKYALLSGSVNTQLINKLSSAIFEEKHIRVDEINVPLGLKLPEFNAAFISDIKRSSNHEVDVWIHSILLVHPILTAQIRAQSTILVGIQTLALIRLLSEPNREIVVHEITVPPRGLGKNIHSVISLLETTAAISKNIIPCPVNAQLITENMLSFSDSWPLKRVANALNVTPTTLKNWEQKSHD